MAILKALVLAVASFTASSFGAPVVDKVSPPHITSSTTDPYGEPQITPFVPFIPGPGHWTTEFTVRGVAFTFGTTPPAWATVLGSGEPDRPTWEPAAWRPAPGVVPHNHAGGENIGPIAKRIVESAAPWNCSHAHPDCCPTEQDHNPCGIWGGVWKRDAGADKDGNPKGLWNGKEKRDEDTGCNTFGCEFPWLYRVAGADTASQARAGRFPTSAIVRPRHGRPSLPRRRMTSRQSQSRQTLQRSRLRRTPMRTL